MEIRIGNQYRVIKNKLPANSHRGYLILLLLCVQLLLSFLGHRYSATIFYAELVPILVLVYLNYKDLQSKTIDLLIILFIILLLSIFLVDILV